MEVFSSLSSPPLATPSFRNDWPTTSSASHNRIVKLRSSNNYETNHSIKFRKLNNFKVKLALIDVLETAANPAQAQLTWQIIIGTLEIVRGWCCSWGNAFHCCRNRVHQKNCLEEAWQDLHLATDEEHVVVANDEDDNTTNELMSTYDWFGSSLGSGVLDDTILGCDLVQAKEGDPNLQCGIWLRAYH
ncbi:hypothetical protein Cgig2_012925 [Carnegiea gigantea]|uniref:Uncharacterized protein n=1 Tax=Carnegiea gigantea TaxID=171969 RepID=A0A9Q1JSU0_9CARY|nr:hypothetical protein Cgig2_012925 [Carnegiea gigantea]